MLKKIMFLLILIFLLAASVYYLKDALTGLPSLERMMFLLWGSGQAG